MNKFDPTSHNVTDEKKAELKALFPEAFTEQGVDFDRLKTLLGEVVETSPERYSFTWPGKTEAIRAAQASSMGTLVPDKASSLDWDTTENLYLEGDNLEILKLLQKSYTGKVKMIYIDPPYNTGKDFVYPDKYGEGLKTYLEYTGQIDGEGKKLSTNTETDGRYHSKWLNMMYPRLMLARNLLKDDGVIFISIDDHEVQNLRKITAEVFGDENFICLITREVIRGGSQSKHIREVHDYVLVFAKHKQLLDFVGLEQEGFELNQTDEHGKYKKGRELNKWGAGSRREDSPGMWFPVMGPNGEDVYPYRNDGTEGRWRLGKKKMSDVISRGDAIFEKRDSGTYVLYEKIRDDSPRYKQFTTLFLKDYTNAKGTETIKSIFGVERSYFDYVKPIELIKDLVLMAGVEDGEYVMDFFAGSSTTAHAVVALNAEDGGDRKYILSQLQEPTPEGSEARKGGYKLITEIGKERIRRAGDKVRKEYTEKIAVRETPLDIGFKTYRLASSTFNVWDVKSSDDVHQKLVGATSLIKDNAKEEDVLTELILKSGYGLTEKVEQLTLADKKVYSVADGALIVSLETGLTLDLVRQVAERKPAQFVAREHGFASDDVLTNTAQIMKDKGINFRVL